MQTPIWRETARETLSRGSRFSFVRVHLQTDDGRRATKEIVVHPGAVSIVPVFRPGDPAYQHLAELAKASEPELQALLDSSTNHNNKTNTTSNKHQAQTLHHTSSSADAHTSGVVMIWNERAALSGVEVLEVPAGTLEAGEPPETCAAREVIEEAGVVAGSLVPLGSFWTTPGLTDENMHVFAAIGLSLAQQDLDENETIRVVPIMADLLARLIDAGIVRDGKTLAALWRCDRQGLIDLRPR